MQTLRIWSLLKERPRLLKPMAQPQRTLAARTAIRKAITTTAWKRSKSCKAILSLNVTYTLGRRKLPSKKQKAHSAPLRRGIFIGKNYSSVSPRLFRIAVSWVEGNSGEIQFLQSGTS